MSLKSVLSEFESSAAVTMDDQYVTECSRIVSKVESNLRDRQLREASGEKFLQNLADAKRVLERIDSEYAAKQKELERRMDNEITSASIKIDVLESELGHISRLRTSILRGLSRKTKTQQEDEAKRNLTFAKGMYVTTTRSFTEEEEKLKEEYEKRKNPVILQIEECQREIQSSGAESQDDCSLEARLEACDALLDSVKRLIDRMQSMGKEAL